MVSKSDRLWLPISSYLIEHPSDLDYVILSHLDCDHVNGLSLVKDAKHILVLKDELEGSNKKGRKNRIRYQSKWWDGCKLESFEWNDTEGPFGKAYDLFGDGSVKMITSGVSTNKEQQLKSLEWIRAESMNENCLESIANHVPDLIPHNIIIGENTFTN